jgi:asparagine synthase (glutamine-hydrolysing)
MPGIIGIAGNIDADLGHQLCKRMAQAVKHEEWYQVELHTEQGCSLGRIGLGLMNSEPQPIWNEDQTICVVMEGELYDYAPVKEGLIRQGHRFTVHNDAEFVLHLYEEVGEEFALLLNGSFVVALWENSTRKLVIATDRMSSHPLYYAHHRRRFLFAPNVHALLVDPGLDKTVDRVAIAQALTFDHILGERTWLEAVHLMPPASLLVYTEDSLKIRTYWTLKYSDYANLHSEQEYVEAFLHHLHKAVKRQSVKQQPGSHLPAGMMLSGGLDSRVLAAVMRDGPLVEPLHTFTWGIPNCDDARFAKDVAHAIGTDHHFVELEPDYLLTHAAKGVRLTNGSNCVHYHSLAALSKETHSVKVIYKGVMGDAMMGTALTRHFWADYEQDELPAFHLRTHRDRGVLLFTPEEQVALFTDAFQQQVNGAVMESYRREMTVSRATQVADQRIHFDLRQRIPRMTWNGIELVRSQAIVRIPYADNDVIEFSTQLPPGFRFERYLMKRVLADQYTKLAQIPITENGLPLTSCARDVLIRSQRLLAWHLNRVGLRNTPFIPKRSYANYDLWFRTYLREWLEHVLLGKRALERGYFVPDHVRRLVTEQVAGANHAVKLGAMISLELWHRQFLD